jgi:hypothetical protein
MLENVTRIEVEKNNNGVLIMYWQVGWKPGDPPTQKEWSAERMFDCLARLETEGFTVDMPSMDVGRALKGEITRIDFFDNGEGEWLVKKFPYGWTARTRAIEQKYHKDFDIQAAIKWCEDHGWSVRQWQALDGIRPGYRAFKYQQEPIRDSASIQSMRRRFEHAQVDFAFCC